MPLDVYWRQANAQAEQAVNVFPPAAAVAPFTGIETLFPFIQHPTPLQKAVLELDISQPGPQLFILEDVTGAGKTEAALILTHRLMSAGKAQGLFSVCRRWRRPMRCLTGWHNRGLPYTSLTRAQPGAGAQRSRVDGGL
jgi:CRISPR/Cas system-associated endonuclease/helicase Cas3